MHPVLPSRSGSGSSSTVDEAAGWIKAAIAPGRQL
jgi:hypothetical protein